MRHVPKACLTILIAATLVVASAAGAAEYEFETLQVPGTGGAANDINNSGQIVGNVGTIGFLIDGDEFTPIEYPGADVTVAFGINDHGTIVGRFAAGGEIHGYVLDNGVFTQVDFPGAPVDSWAFGINNQGDVIGLWCDDDGTPPCAFSAGAGGDSIRGYLLDKNGFSVVSFPGSVDTFSLRIADDGSIAGQYYDATTGFAFVRDKDGVYNTIAVPGATESEARGISNRGDVTGLFFADPFDIVGFLKEKDGDVVAIDVPGATFTGILGMNDLGDVVGIHFGGDFVFNPFVGRRVGQP